MLNKIFYSLIPTALTLCVAVSTLFANGPGDSTLVLARDTVVFEIFPDDPVLARMDNLWLDERIHWLPQEYDTACLNVYKFAADFIPEYPDSIIEDRLRLLNMATPLDLEYNNYVKGFINLYANRKRELTSRVLGLAELYYPLFEEKLDQFNIPLELKHLAVVESALNPSARSRVGATGLWQFMYSTGRIYGLDVDSYVDERSDPYKSTIAACRYMRALYAMYGDWNLVLAAYNSGPGNVNKAIRRSGGHRNYWEIRPYLPRETRSYVPAFIAVNYVMNHSAEHNLYPIRPDFIHEEIDTVNVCRALTLEQLAYFTHTPITQLELINPSIKNGIIPESPRCKAVYLPLPAVGLYLANEDSLRRYKPAIEKEETKEPTPELLTHYTVRRGDVLGVIAERNGVGLSQLREWNGIRGNNIYPGQKLKIYGSKMATASNSSQKEKAAASKTTAAVGTKSDGNGATRLHVVQSGDTLWDIAKKYPGISVNDLKVLNADMNYNRLKPGQKIKIPPSS